MTDIAINVFQLANTRGLFVPPLNFRYTEIDTGLDWWITCGGTRAYLVRFGNPLKDDLEEQAADSHFMVKRVTSSLLLAGFGLFQPKATGRVLFRRVGGELSWTAHLDIPLTPPPSAPEETIDRVHAWIRSLCEHTTLRRAADDAHLALTHPHEALLYVYRGFEWLVVGLGIAWDDLAGLLGIPVSEMRELQKIANVDLGVRHASKTGLKVRAHPDFYGSWVCGLFDAINAARKKFEPGYQVMSPKEVAEAVMKGAPSVPYE